MPSADTDRSSERHWSSLFARRPRVLVLLLLLLSAAGGAAFGLLPRREDPELVGRFAQILTRLPGADARRVEALVTKPLEDKIREHESIGKVTASSREGVSFIVAELADDVSDPPRELAKLRDLVTEAEAELPASAGKPEFDDFRPEAWAMLAALVWRGEEAAPEAILRRIAEDLEDRFRNLRGSKESSVFGDAREEYRVRFDAAELARQGLDARAVARDLTRSDPKLRTGRVRNEALELDIRLSGEIDGVERLRRVVLRDEGPEGQVLVGDVAEVTRGTEDPPRQRALVDDRRAVLVGARIASRERADLWAERAHDMLERYRLDLPPDVELRVVFDQSRYVTSRLHGLAENLAVGAGLVALVILLFFGLRAAVLVALALPLTVLGVLAGLQQISIPLHQMSVTGLILALGLLIDNAIIVVDEVRQRLAARSSPSRMGAIAASVRHLALPLLGSTLTTALAFLPIAIMPGPAGDFVGSISISVILAIFISLFLSLTVIASLAGRFLPTRGSVGRAAWLRSGIAFPGLARAHDRLVAAFLRRPLLGILASVVLPLVGFVGAGTLDEQFFPPAERDQFQLQLLMPASASIEASEAAVRTMQREVAAIDGVRSSFTIIGNSAPLVYYNMMSGQDDSSWFAQSIVSVDDASRCRAVVRAVQLRLDEALPGAQCIAREFEQGPPFPAPIELLIFGEDPEVLADLAEEYRNVLAEIPGVVHTRATLDSVMPRLEFRVDELEAQTAGLRLEDLRERISAGLEGMPAGSVLEGSEFVPVRASFLSNRGRDLRGASSIELATGDGAIVPLEALGDFQLVPSISSLPREDGRRMTAIYGFLEPGLLPAKVLAAFEERRQELRALDLPSGYEFDIGGESAERDDAMGGLFASVAILTILMLATLVLTLASFRLAGLISLVAGLSIGLAFASLFLFGQVMGFMAILGAMGLVGVAINDSIVVLAAIRADEAAARGEADAMRRVVAHSSRHVLATTVTTIAGFLPLIFAGGEFWPPLVIGIAGGVVGATMLALWFVPSAYRLLRPKQSSASGA